MNVKPRLDHTLDIATADRAVPGSRSNPGLLMTGNRSPSQPRLESAPTSGCRRNNHIRLDTATEVATVDEKTARNTPIPRRYLSARIARPTPSAKPSGTVISASLTVTHRACRNSGDRNVSTYWSHPFETHWRPCTLQRC